MEARTSQTHAIEREIRIDADPATVFDFFTNPEMMVRWKGRAATLDPRPGGVYRGLFELQATEFGRISAAE